jgi:hypothetical protein
MIAVEEPITAIFTMTLVEEVKRAMSVEERKLQLVILKVRNVKSHHRLTHILPSSLPRRTAWKLAELDLVSVSTKVKRAWKHR